MEQAHSIRALKALGLLLLSTTAAGAPALAAEAASSTAKAGTTSSAELSSSMARFDAATQVQRVEQYPELKAALEALSPQEQAHFHQDSHAKRLAKPLAERSNDRRAFVATLFAKPKAERVALMRAAYEVEIAEYEALDPADRAVWYGRYYEEIQSLTDAEATALRKLIRELYDASTEAYRQVMVEHNIDYAAQVGPDCCGRTEDEIGLPTKTAADFE